MIPEKAQKIIGLIKLYGNKNFWEGVYSERGNEQRVTEQANLSDKVLAEIAKELDDTPQSNVCEGCGQRDVLCVCNQE